MKLADYPCPLPGGAAARELAVVFDQGRAARVLVAPALFDEAGRMRRFTLEVMRRLDSAGIDSFLPDLPGCNESLRERGAVEPEDWRMALEGAARHFAASHVLAIRGGALIVPAHLPGWLYAPARGDSLVRTLLRARIIAAREEGREEDPDALLERGLIDGLELAGHLVSAETLRQLGALVPPRRAGLAVIEQAMIGGGGLWLRAEPGEDRAQVEALAAVLAVGIAE